MRFSRDIEGSTHDNLVADPALEAQFAGCSRPTTDLDDIVGPHDPHEAGSANSDDSQPCGDQPIIDLGEQQGARHDRVSREMPGERRMRRVDTNPHRHVQPGPCLRRIGHGAECYTRRNRTASYNNKNLKFPSQGPRLPATSVGT